MAPGIVVFATASSSVSRRSDGERRDYTMEPGDKAKAALSSLRSLLANHATRDVVAVYLDLCMRRANDLEFHGELVSPAQQGDVLLTLLLSTVEPVKPRPYEAKDWQRTTELLNEAFVAYQGLFWPDAAESGGLSEEWKHVREVAMPAFLHYFNTGLIANPEQVRARITAYLSPFDEALRGAGLMSASDALRIADWVGARLERALGALNTVLDEVDEAQKSTAKHAKDFTSAREFARSHFPHLGDQLTTALHEFGSVAKTEIVGEFGELGERYWRQFSVGRGEATPITYPTEANAAATHPLIRLNDERAMVPSINALWTALLKVGERVATQPATRERYLAHRDGTLEAETASQFRRLVSRRAQVFEGAFEYPKSRGEHDTIIVDGDTVFIVEAKASPLLEPFRDPEKAFTRLRRAFRADRGIQKGFEQAESVRIKLERGESVRLYDQRGNQIALLDPAIVKHRFSVVVTRDDFGSLATDLALLLEKATDTPYPWVVNILDLSAIADAWQHLGWGTAQLRAYLEPRLRLHGKVVASDELEIAGYHLQHGSLDSLVNNVADRVNLVPSYSNFFDQLYRHQRYGGPPPVAQNTLPVVMDLRASLAAGAPVFVDSAGKVIEREQAKPISARRMNGTERNRPCPCGSGRKFKRCCGK
jgi:hypothetical protein